MRRTYLGEFEEMVLLMVAILNGEGYGVTISQALEEHTGAASLSERFTTH
jgi:PadR family transcriptional regulator PadR